jgi:diacylglycerol kinase (ATP)
MFEPSNKKQGLARLISAFSNTYKGLIWMAKNEAAFKQELLLSVALVVLSCYLDITLKEQAILIISLLFVLFTETLNTAIEAVVDRIGYDYHELSGLAKDLASSAVFISMIIAVIIWGAVLIA